MVLMATEEPHRQHSFMSPATWQLRQGRQKDPHKPGGQRDMGLAEGSKRKGGKNSQELWLLTSGKMVCCTHSSGVCSRGSAAGGSGLAPGAHHGQQQE